MLKVLRVFALCGIQLVFAQAVNAVPFASVDRAFVDFRVNRVTDESGRSISMSEALYLVEAERRVTEKTNKEGETNFSSRHSIYTDIDELYISAGLHTSVDRIGFARSSIEIYAEAIIKNITTSPIIVFIYYSFSAFNPGGSDIGASVDNLDYQYALFSSSVYSSSGDLSDHHSCDTREHNYYQISPLACGVASPDESGGELYFWLAPGEQFVLNAGLSLLTEVRSVPEPSTALLILMGGLAFPVIRIGRNRSNPASHRNLKRTPHNSATPIALPIPAHPVA